jgi:hypothetical protein
MKVGDGIRIRFQRAALLRIRSSPEAGSRSGPFTSQGSLVKLKSRAHRGWLLENPERNPGGCWRIGNVAGRCRFGLLPGNLRSNLSPYTGLSKSSLASGSLVGGVGGHRVCCVCASSIDGTQVARVPVTGWRPVKASGNA